MDSLVMVIVLNYIIGKYVEIVKIMFSRYWDSKEILYFYDFIIMLNLIFNVNCRSY